MQKIIFVSNNKNKAKEVTEILKNKDIQVIHKAIELEEIQSPEVESVARNKALCAYQFFNVPILVEDSGLFIKAMHNYPGSLTKHFLASIGTQGIIHFLKDKDRQARAVTAFAFCKDKANIHTFVEHNLGKISNEIRGTSGFAYDHIFIPEGHKKTYAQMSSAEKNKISQRRKALEKFALWITTTT